MARESLMGMCLSLMVTGCVMYDGGYDYRISGRAVFPDGSSSIVEFDIVPKTDQQSPAPGWIALKQLQGLREFLFQTGKDGRFRADHSFGIEWSHMKLFGFVPLNSFRPPKRAPPTLRFIIKHPTAECFAIREVPPGEYDWRQERGEYDINVGVIQLPVVDGCQEG